MSFCTACGRPGVEGDRFCADCGTEFPDLGSGTPPAPADGTGLENTDPDGIPVIRDPSALEPIDSPAEQPIRYDQPLPLLTADQEPDWAAQDIVPFPTHGPPVSLPRPARQRSGRRGRIVAAVVFSAALVVIAAGAFALTSMGTGRTGAGGQPAGRASGKAASPVSRQPTSARSAARPAASSRKKPFSGRPASPAGTVTVSAAAAGNPAAGVVAVLLDRYFTTINKHDYSGYENLLAGPMRQQVTASSFASGYKTTRDSGAVLASLSGSAGDDLAAAVTFTSHQDPADSPSASSCTVWAITLYLVPSGSDYLIDTPPPGYQPSFRSC